MDSPPRGELLFSIGVLRGGPADGSVGSCLSSRAGSAGRRALALTPRLSHEGPAREPRCRSSGRPQTPSLRSFRAADSPDEAHLGSNIRRPDTSAHRPDFGLCDSLTRVGYPLRSPWPSQAASVLAESAG